MYGNYPHFMKFPAGFGGECVPLRAGRGGAGTGLAAKRCGSPGRAWGRGGAGAACAPEPVGRGRGVGRPKARG